jgi:hypothetical protein
VHVPAPRRAKKPAAHGTVVDALVDAHENPAGHATHVRADPSE